MSQLQVDPFSKRSKFRGGLKQLNQQVAKSKYWGLVKALIVIHLQKAGNEPLYNGVQPKMHPFQKGCEQLSLAGSAGTGENIDFIAV